MCEERCCECLTVQYSMPARKKSEIKEIVLCALSHMCNLTVKDRCDIKTKSIMLCSFCNEVSNIIIQS